MKKYFEIYDPQKVYYSPVNEVFTPEHIAMNYAIVNSGLPCVIETDKNHIRFNAVGLLTEFLDFFNLDEDLVGAEAIQALEDKANEVIEHEPSAEERIAAAMEFQNLLSM